MKYTRKIRDFTEKLRNEYEREFADEQILVDDLLDLYFEATKITKSKILKSGKDEIFMLINRIYNDIYAGWHLIMLGLLSQGMTLFRDTIECSNYIKLFDVDPEFRKEWSEGKDFFLRDVRD